MSDLFRPTKIVTGTRRVPVRPPMRIRPPTEGKVGTRVNLVCATDTDGDATATMTLPTYSVGDLVIVNLVAAATTFTTPTGWNVGAGPFTNQTTEVIYWRVMTGSEGSELDITMSGVQARVVAISFVHRGLDFSTLTPDFSTISTVANAPSVAFSHGNAIPYDVYIVNFSQNDTGAREVTITDEDGYTELSDCGGEPRAWLWHKRIAAGASSEDPNMQFDQPFDDEFGVCTYAVAAESPTPDVASGDHTHTEADITDLPGHSHTESDITDLDHTTAVAKAGTLIGTRGRINFIEGTDIGLTVADDAANDEVDVTVAYTGAGGGGGGSTVPDWVADLATPDSAHGDDQEFTGTIAGTAVTPTGTVTWTQDEGLLSAAFDSQTSGDQAPRLYALTPTASPVTITTRMRMLTRRQANPMCGLMFTDGTTTGSTATSVAVYANTGTSGTILGRWVGTPAAMTTTNLITDLPFDLYTQWLYLRLIWSASNTFEFAMSLDGISWTDFGDTGWSTTLTPTHFGPFVSAWSRTFVSTASFEYVRVAESDLSV